MAARDARAQSLKADGDAVAAQAVRSLRKPSAAAWALNLLVREDRVQVDALLALGGELREAAMRAQNFAREIMRAHDSAASSPAKNK